MAFGLTDAGLTVRTEAQTTELIRDEIQANFNAAGLPYDIDWSSSTVLGQITAAVGAVGGDSNETIAAVYDGTQENNATGIQLDNIGAITGVTRDPARASRAVVTLGGTAGVVVPAGYQVQGDDGSGETRWALLADTEIPSTTALVEAVDTGPIQASPGTITTIVTPYAGWDTVTNAAAAEPGENRELDSEYRVSRREKLSAGSSTSLDAVRDSVDSLTFIESAAAIENNESYPQVIEGVALPPGPLFNVIVWPNTLTDDEKTTVAQTIYANMPAGVKAYGTAEVFNVTKSDGVTQTIAYDYATQIPVAVSVTITRYGPGATLATLTPLIEQAVTAYFDSLSTGGDVLTLKIDAAIGAIQGLEGATVLLSTGGPATPNDVIITALQISDLSGVVVS